MVKRQGSKLVENVTKIECSNDVKGSGSTCRVISQRSIPTRYRDIEEVDTDNVKLDKYEARNGDYVFNKPVECEIVFGSELNRIKCRD